MSEVNKPVIDVKKLREIKEKSVIEQEIIKK
jgi:hypothetical protein